MEEGFGVDVEMGEVDVEVGDEGLGGWVGVVHTAQ